MRSNKFYERFGVRKSLPALNFSLFLCGMDSLEWRKDPGGSEEEEEEEKDREIERERKKKEMRTRM